MRFLTVAWLLLFAFGTATAATHVRSLGVMLYIATDGKDTNLGTLDSPFATLERAREEVRRLTGSGGVRQPINIYIRGGRYYLPRTFSLNASDSGMVDARVTYQAFKSEQPVLVGGTEISGFSPYKGEILQANMVPLGLKGSEFRQLLFDGERQPLARYPNYDSKNPYGGGWAYVAGKPVPMYRDLPNDRKDVITYKEDDARTWAHPEDGELFIFARYNWYNDIVRIKSQNLAAHTITLASNASYAIRPTDRYYVQGMMEELDAPGEWYLDPRTWTLYFWPPAPLDGKSICAPTLDTIVRMVNTSYVTLRGLTFECSKGTAVLLKNCSDCFIAANTIRNVGYFGGHGVKVTGGFRNGVVGNDISNTGHDAINITGGDRVTLTPGDSYADNNYIHNPGIYYRWGTGVNLTGCGLRATHNLIHDCPRAAISFRGNNLLIEYNRLHHLALDSEDAGGVVTGGRDWISSRGSVVRYNIIHDVLGYGRHNGRWVSPFFSWGIYLDDNTGGVDVIGNIVYHCGRGGLHLHNARDTKVENNVFVDNALSEIDLSGWTATSEHWHRHLPTMKKGYNSVLNQPAWQQIRGMKIRPEDAPLPNGLIMAGNEFQRNIIANNDPDAMLYRVSRVDLGHNHWDRNLLWQYGAPPRIGGIQNTPRERIWPEWHKLGEDLHSLVADPLFVDAANADYRLQPNSPAFDLGFQRIPVKNIGPYESGLRVTWPIIETVNIREYLLR